MPADKARQGDTDLRHSTVMVGILTMLVAEREERLSDDAVRPTKTEVLLNNAGFTSPEVAQIMGKSPAAVRKTIQRGRK
jgi:DNA-directed RNA polymerase specialized sigma24 family protein